MSKEFKHYKRKFRNHLQPNFAVLLAKRKEMPEDTWEAYVKNTLSRIYNNPREFLGNDLPSRSLIHDILEEIKTEFIKETRAVRKSVR